MEEAASLKHLRVSFEEWNGDKLANLIRSHFLREDLIGDRSRSDLRKTLALLDEPRPHMNISQAWCVISMGLARTTTSIFEVFAN
jgi:hypothetical protein